MSDLVTFSRKLMRINERVVKTNTPSAIFGSVGDLVQAVSGRASLRIGLWPCISEEEPQIAMALWVTLAHLLERHRDIEVYRLFAQFEGDPEEFVWTIDKSQFTIEDWDLESLDENVGMWGTLSQKDGKWELNVSIDNDNLTGEGSDTEIVAITADTPFALFSKMPEFVQKIADTLDAGFVDHTDPVYNIDTLADTATMREFLEKMIEWDVNLIALLWGVEWEDEDINDDFLDYIDAAKSVGNEFSAWAVSKAAAQTMRPGYTVVGDLIVDRVKNINEALDNHLVLPIVGGGVFDMGFATQSYRLLENEVAKRPNSVYAWLKLSEMYANGGLFEQSIDRFQTAIENEAINGDLFRSYGNGILAAEQAKFEFTDFIMIDLSEYDQDYVAWEAISAYSAAIEENPEDIRAIYSALVQLSDVDWEQAYLWDYFVKLIKLDTKGEYIRDVIDGLYNVQDIQTGVNALSALIKENPERVDLLINLGALYLAVDEGESAVPPLEKALVMAKETATIADVERLLLSAKNPDFEYRFAEVTSILDAGNKLNADDVEFLEDVVENAPNVISAHIALARSYYYWGEPDEALEVLLDAQEQIPDQPVVIDWLARILWESNERETAFTYINRGLLAYPFNVQLLSRAGKYLFDNNQLDEARAYLGRAEEIAPGHPMLKSVREYIARQIADNPSKYKEELQ